MKEPSIKEKAKRYDEAIEKLRNLHDNYDTVSTLIDIKEELENIFPELKESEDERIRKELINYLTNELNNVKQLTPRTNQFEDWVAWLEKQGEQKPADKVEPKFKVGDYITDNTSTFQIVRVENEWYYADDGDKICFDVAHQYYHLWTIQDAKDGDVLSYVTDEEDLWIMIYWSLYEPYEGHVHYHALLVNNNFSDKGTCCICIDDLKPATEEQCELLFQKMKEAGYEWDADKKELKKIELNPAWSEEDERNLQGIIDEIKANKTDAPDYDLATYDRFLSWLKSLKERVLPQNIAYYNPYKEVVESIAKMYKRYDRMDVGSLQDFYDNVKVKCKDAKEYDSLFPQSTWKPSLSQLNALGVVVKGNAPDDIEEIKSLYNDLKKL